MRKRSRILVHELLQLNTYNYASWFGNWINWQIGHYYQEIEKKSYVFEIEIWADSVLGY